MYCQTRMISGNHFLPLSHPQTSIHPLVWPSSECNAPLVSLLLQLWIITLYLCASSVACKSSICSQGGRPCARKALYMSIMSSLSTTWRTGLVRSYQSPEGSSSEGQDRGQPRPYACKLPWQLSGESEITLSASKFQDKAGQISWLERHWVLIGKVWQSEVRLRSGSEERNEGWRKQRSSIQRKSGEKRLESALRKLTQRKRIKLSWQDVTAERQIYAHKKRSKVHIWHWI